MLFVMRETALLTVLYVQISRWFRSTPWLRRSESLRNVIILPSKLMSGSSLSRLADVAYVIRFKENI